MKIISPYWMYEHIDDSIDILKRLERAGRTCYKSEDKITPESSKKFLTMIRQRGHESVLEHEKITVRVICDRGVSHEIVRHRIASYSQESTRYCNYGHENEIMVILPLWYKEVHEHFQKLLVDNPVEVFETTPESLDDIGHRYWNWRHSCAEAEISYMRMIKYGAHPQEARSVLPNSLKTEIVITYNLREWRHFFKLRTSKAAHPQMREITLPMLRSFKLDIPIIFDDIIPEEN